MKIKELINGICENIDHDFTNTCDTVKAGDPEKEIKKVAVSMFASVDTLKKVIEWGADLLIVHEPTYYNHMDNFNPNDKVAAEKKRIIEESGITIFRYHDHAHARVPDLITAGELKALGLKGTLEMTPYFASYLFTSDEEITGLEIAKRAEKNLGVGHVKIIGSYDKKATKIAACFGTPGGRDDLIRRDDVEIMITGEICEWAIGEYVRDSAALSYNKTLLVFGHIGSERDGMIELANEISEKYSLETKYFETGEVYTYTDKINK